MNISISDVSNLFQFVGGLGMFLYGMHMMAEGLQHFAGGRMQRLMGLLTKNRFAAILVGTLVTAVIQSSSATTVMVVGFVNAGMLNLSQAVGVIMGANIGTTVTAWIVSMSEWGSIFKPEFFAPLLLGIGAFVVLFVKSSGKKKIGEILVGFSILFIGLSFMSGAIKPYREAKLFSDAFLVLGKSPFLAILVGAIVTAIIQSSSASVGILQTLAMNGFVTWQSAVFITLGQNIGTCVTALISSAGTGRNAKRASVIHLLFNICGAVIFSIVMSVLFFFNKEWAQTPISSVEISIFHTVFNVTCTVLLLPFADKLVALSGVIIRGKEKEEEAGAAAQMAKKLDSRILNNPSFAIETAGLEVAAMGSLAKENLQKALAAVEKGEAGGTSEIYNTEKEINEMEKLLTSFLVEVDNLSLTEEQHIQVKNLFYTVSDIERVGDHAENIAEMADTLINDGNSFSKKGMADLQEIAKEAVLAFETAVEARRLQADEGKKLALAVQDYESRVDTLEEELREKHLKRLSKGKCKPESGVVFLDIISNLERISDHASNIAGYVADEANFRYNKENSIG